MRKKRKKEEKINSEKKSENKATEAMGQVILFPKENTLLLNSKKRVK